MTVGTPFADAVLKEVYAAKLALMLDMSRTLWHDPRSRSFMYWPAPLVDCPPLEQRLARRIKRARYEAVDRFRTAVRVLRGDDLHEGCYD